MALREEVLSAVMALNETQFNFLPPHPIIFIYQIEAVENAIEKIYPLLAVPTALFTVDQVARCMWYETASERKIRISVDEKTIETLAAIFEKKKVQIASVGPYAIYLDITSERKIIVDTRFARVLGNHVQLGLHLYPNTLEAINWLELLGPLDPTDGMVINSKTGALTLFLKDGTDIPIEVDHPYHATLVALAKKQRIEIGTELSDLLFFSLATGSFHRSSDGSLMTPGDLERETIVDRNEAVMSVIQMLSQFESARIINKKADSPDIFLTTSLGEETVITPIHLHYEIFLKIVKKQPVQVGKMSGEVKVMFSLIEGAIIMHRKRVSHLEFNTVKENFPALIQAANGVKLFRDSTNPNVIHAIHPGGEVEKINKSHILFSFYNRLLKGIIIYTFLNKNQEEVPYIVFYSARGLTVQALSHQEFNERKDSGNERFMKMDFQPKRTEQNLAQPVPEVINKKRERKKKDEKKKTIKMSRRKQRVM